MSAINLAFFLAAVYFLLRYFNRLSEDSMQSIISITHSNRAFWVTLWSDPRVSTKLNPLHPFVHAKEADPRGDHSVPLPLSSFPSYHLSHINYANDAVHDRKVSLRVKDDVDLRDYQWDCSSCARIEHDPNVRGVGWGWNENITGISNGICRFCMHWDQPNLFQCVIPIRPLSNSEKSVQLPPCTFREPR